MSIPVSLAALTASGAVTSRTLGARFAELRSVKDYGALGNGSADDTNAFQDAADDTPAYGGLIRMPASAAYYPIGNVDCGQKAIKWVGEGGPGVSDLLGHGATELLVKNGTVGMIFGTGNLFRGPVIEDVRFVAESSSSLGGILFNGISGAILRNVHCSNFTGAGAYGRKYTGGASGASLTMFNEEYGCGAASCTIGVWGIRSVGLMLIGGSYDGNDNFGGDGVAGSKGVYYQAPGDTLTVIGTRFQSYAIHIDNECEGLVVKGTRHEGFEIAIRSTGDMCTIEPGDTTNAAMGGDPGIGIQVSGNRNFVNAQSVNSVATRVSSTATSTIIIDNSTIAGATLV